MITLFVGIYVRIGILFIRVCSDIIFVLAIVLSVLCFAISDISLVYSYISLYKSSKQMILVFFLLKIDGSTQCKFRHFISYRHTKIWLLNLNSFNTNNIK